MKFFENLPKDEQDIMLFETVAFSATLEGMTKPAERLLQQADKLKAEAREQFTQALESGNPER